MSLKLIGEVALDGSGFENGLKRLEGAATSFGNNLSNGIGRQIFEVFSAAAVIEFTRQIVEASEQLRNAAVRFQTTSEHVQEFRFAAKQAGEDLELMERALDKIADAFTKNGAERDKAIAALQRLGASAESLRSQNAAKILTEIGEAFESMAVTSGVTTDMLDIFGTKMGTRLIPVLKEYAENVGKLKQQGGPIQDRDLAILQDFGNSSSRVFEAVRKQWTQLSAEAAGASANIVAATDDVASGFKALISVAKGTSAKDAWDIFSQTVKGRHLGIAVTQGDAMRFDTRDTGGTPAEMFGINKRTHFEWRYPNRDTKEYAESQRVIEQVLDERKRREYELLNIEQKRAFLLKEIAQAEKDTVSDSVKKSNEAALRVEKLKTQLQQLGIKDEKQARHIPEDSLVRVGNFMGSGKNALEDIGHEHTRLLSQIAQNTMDKRLRTENRFLGDYNEPTGFPIA